MDFLKREREVLDYYLPGFDQALANKPLMEWEQPGHQGFALFQEKGGAGLLIPRDYGGLGASALEAIQIQRAVGSRSPSLAIGTTMHHFSTAALLELTDELQGLEKVLLKAICEQGILIASAFAEGQPNRSILSPTMQGNRTKNGLVVNGIKRPCTLTWSMGLLTASVSVPSKQGGKNELAVILIPATTPGLERRKFWNSWLLAGAESDEIILKDVFVEDKLVFYAGDIDNLQSTAINGFIWFELLATASYVGVVSGLVERMLISGRGQPGDRVQMVIELEAAMSALEGVAFSLMEGKRDHDMLARSLFVRYATERILEQVAARAAELLGGMAYITSPEISYLLAVSRALSFHPPSRSSMIPNIEAYLAGAGIKIP